MWEKDAREKPSFSYCDQLSHLTNTPTNLQPQDDIGNYGEKDACMYVVVPERKDQDVPQTKFWVVDGSVENAQTTRVDCIV